MREKRTMSQRVRDAMAELPPNTPAKEVVAHAGLPEHAKQYVYTFRSLAKQKKRRGPRASVLRGRREHGAQEQNQRSKFSHVSVEDLLVLHPIVEQLGGCERTKGLVAALEQLQTAG